MKQKMKAADLKWRLDFRTPEANNMRPTTKKLIPWTQIHVMSPESLTLLGYVAASITTGSFFPQVYRTWKTKSVEDLSYWMLSLFLLGIGLWLIYGIELGEMPIILANAVTGVLVFCLIAMKYTYSRRPKESNE